MNKLDFKEKMKKAKYQTLKEGKKWGKKEIGIVADGVRAMERLGGVYGENCGGLFKRDC